jgi:phosphatidylglycerol:prolipoprotein diacylglycerol transferase
VSSYLHLGRFHLPVFGLFAAVGIVAAMALSQKTARMADMDPGGVWDLGMVTVFSAYAISRILLVATAFRAFLQYPLLVLELPSLTTAGMLLTVLVSLGYARYRQLKLLPLLDAWAPCACLLWVFMSAGWVVNGTRDGMPSNIPWAIGSGYGRVHPVEVYRVVVTSVVCGLLLLFLRQGPVAGAVARRGLLLGGLSLVLIDFFRLPDELFTPSWLDGVQWVGVAMMVLGVAMKIAPPWIPIRSRVEMGSSDAV